MRSTLWLGDRDSAPTSFWSAALHRSILEFFDQNPRFAELAAAAGLAA